MRYRMLQPIRQYAREKREESEEADEVHRRQAAFFLALAEAAEPELVGPQQRVWVERLEEEHDNLREALSWVLERGRPNWDSGSVGRSGDSGSPEATLARGEGGWSEYSREVNRQHRQ